jgi:hypothetical protein
MMTRNVNDDDDGIKEKNDDNDDDDTDKEQDINDYHDDNSYIKMKIMSMMTLTPKIKQMLNRT